MVHGQMAEVAAASERVARGSEELAGLSEELRELVSQFQYEKEESSGAGLVPAEKKGVPAKKGKH